MRIAFFTAGTVGAGHVVLGMAVERGLRRAGFSGEFRMFGPEEAFPTTQGPSRQIVRINQDELENPFTAANSALNKALHEYRPDLLLVDIFWAPLLYILPVPGCECWLLIRKVPDRWLEGTFSSPFDPKPYTRIIGTEPLTFSALTDTIDPIVVCNPDECRPPVALRNELEVPDGRRLVVVAQAGMPGEVDELDHEASSNDFVLHSSLIDREAFFPLAEWLPGADLIYGGAGYNMFWEAKWLGYYDRCRFTAFERRVDDQAWRLRECDNYSMTRNGADQLATWIMQG
jgi:hypothetical protein